MNSLNSTKKSLRNSLIIILFNLFFLGNLNFAQVNPDINFYPLHVGDTWQYFVEYDSDFDYEETTYYIQRSVVGVDTISGREYFVLESKDNNYLNKRYLRIDSSNATIWEYFDWSELDPRAMSSGLEWGGDKLPGAERTWADDPNSQPLPRDF